MNADPVIRNIEGSIPLDAAMLRIESLLGLRYQPHQCSDLLRVLKPAAKELEFKDMTECIFWLAQGEISPAAVQVLGKHLTIGESYFFREIVVFSLLKEHLLPEIIAKKKVQNNKSIRIWSAGCSTGEEVYSLAILLDSILGTSDDWTYSVLGTDINPIAIQRAKSGLYREWSFRDVPEGIVKDYFTPHEDGIRKVALHIQKNTDFQYLNLVEAPSQYPAGFDIILCRNVLMYFTRKNIHEIVQGFRRSVVESGWLIPSLTETTLINNPGFEGVRFGEATIFRKQAQIAHILSLRQESKDDPVVQPELSKKDTDTPKSSFISILPFPNRKPSGKTDFASGDIDTNDLEDVEIGKKTLADLPPESETPTDLPPDVMKLPLATSVTSTPDPLLESAMNLADKGRLDEALTAARSAVESAKMDPNARFIYATILRENGETSKAMQEFHRSLYLDPQFIPAHFAMGSLYRHLGEHSHAKRHLRNALQLLKAYQNRDMMIQPGEISAGRMIDIIETMMDR